MVAQAKTLPRRIDVAVVGGGFAGLSAAYHIARDRGRSVVLLEAGSLGGEASGRNTGLLGPGVVGPIDLVRRRCGSETAARSFKATLDAVGYVVNLVREERLACDLELNGQLVVARTEKQARALESQARAFDELGFDVPWLDRDEVRARIGTDAFVGGIYYRKAANLDPRKLVAELARVARERGVTAHEHTPVRAVFPGKPARLELDGRTLVADRVVLATNAFTPRLGYLRGRVVPLHSHVLATEPLSPRLVRTLAWPGREGAIDARRFFSYFRLTADDRLLYGGGKPLYKADRNDPTAGAVGAADPRQWNRLERELALVFPSLEGVAIEDRWSGVMGFTLDRTPVVGELDEAPGVLHVGAWCGHGVALSIASGAVVADLLASRPRPCLPWLRGSAPWLPPDPFRALGLAGYLSGLGLADRIDSLTRRRNPTTTTPRATPRGAAT